MDSTQVGGLLFWKCTNKKDSHQLRLRPKLPPAGLGPDSSPNHQLRLCLRPKLLPAGLGPDSLPTLQLRLRLRPELLPGGLGPDSLPTLQLRLRLRPELLPGGLTDTKPSIFLAVSLNEVVPTLLDPQQSIRCSFAHRWQTLHTPCSNTYAVRAHR